jgi:hypothetical protein
VQILTAWGEDWNQHWALHGPKVLWLASRVAKLSLAQDDEADQLLSENPFALLVGMLLDQQVAIHLEPCHRKVFEPS